jgi:hypothetical protein
LPGGCNIRRALSPAACEDSLRRAKVFFARHFPEIKRFVIPGTPLHDKVIGHLEAGRHRRVGSGWLET